MADQDEQYEKSWILHHILDRYIGSRKLVAVRRKLTFVKEQIMNCRGGKCNTSYVGSLSEGIQMKGSDIDIMFVDTHVIVLCPEQCISTRLDSTKTVFIMRDADSRPGYVHLELVNLGQTCNPSYIQCLVLVRDALFISSEIYSRVLADEVGAISNKTLETNGPAFRANNTQNNCARDIDSVISFPCTSWPREANEWVSRTRMYEWPGSDLRDQIVQGGCHLVSVGDRTSPDTFLHWRISFVCAEKKLIHSLSHVQFLVYGLLKNFLKQISHSFGQQIKDADIISSYIMKTTVFHAVESTPCSLWQERNTFFCFMLCLNILIAWVNTGHCPNYFIKSNNMFLGTVHGENQQNILRILIELHDKKWNCLSVGTVIQPSIGLRINSVQNGEWEYVLPPPTQSEQECDMLIFSTLFSFENKSASLPVALTLLSKSKSDIDEFIGYICTVFALSDTGVDTFEKHVAAKGNKEKYKYLRKCKDLLAPLSLVCTSPGQLTLATYYYQTGNYVKTLEMCRNMVSSFKIYVGDFATFRDKDRYEHLYCGRGYTLLHKCQGACASLLHIKQSHLSFCLSQLHKELINLRGIHDLLIPPLPYAVFLSFLCYHELGDTRRRNEALIHLRALKYDEEQGCYYYWIVNNILGKCYEMVGDTSRALREYRDSLGGQRPNQDLNTAEDSIERLQRSQ
ncbi:uncharacterized protein LOC110453386 [Mizuhopecten yessoensis]|uniref:Cyclic GMP-AMP synthase n=1 Tax=Mizuhopecten yessoensis TaxID=6573 RepID=A0A210QHD8_MIZYE|nr:uncharacterized protein LOC110453386 [Mizuhopecten yessoensis]XP_021357985.1 uncharacterized protein LOC110453386 [Mizuhopecten yessoensis]XP_021357986.1 uncharacterized protein LOC110453386 [Mizuhopecten yessoensis]OWF48185.1 Cyclic GMP-AMP synthase [Mizuhopecten yessoensis]